MPTNLSISLRLGSAALASGGTPAPAPAPGASATTYPTTPSVQYHINSNPPSVDGSNRLTTLTDMQGLANMVAVSGTNAPKLLTDGLGRKFLRFNSPNAVVTAAEAAAIGNALVLNNRAFTIVMVGRVYHGDRSIPFVNPRFSAYTSPTVNTAANASIGYLRQTVTSASAAFLQAGLPSASTNATDCYKAIPGCQMQVIGLASRTTANGGTRIYMNNQTCDVAQQTTLVTGYTGAVISGTAGASNTDTITPGAFGAFDVYALAIWVGELSNAQADAVVAAAVSNYQIAALDQNFVIEGDSITDGVPTTQGTSPGYCGGLGEVLTRPSAPLVASNVRVVNMGTSGNTVALLTTKRNGTNSIYASGLYPGGASKNRVAVQIGANDFANNAISPAVHYSNVTALINTTTTGYLQRGWNVVLAANIAGNATALPSAVEGATTLQARVEAFRALIADTTNHVPLGQFLTDTASNTGQAFDGLVTVLHTYDIAFGSGAGYNGGTPFKTASTAANVYPAGLYDNDNKHLPVEGIEVMASGGTTPQYGYGSLA